MKFEYATLVMDTGPGLAAPRLNQQDLYDRLNEYGAEGWDLVTIFTVTRSDGLTDQVTAVFKRPRT